MREKIIDINIYRRSVAFMLGTEDEIASRLAELKAYDLAGRVNEMDWDNTLALTLCDGSGVYVVSVRPMTLPTLCHELTHVVYRIFQIIGADDPINEEAYAYLYEYLLTEITSASDEFPLQLFSDACQHTSQ